MTEAALSSYLAAWEALRHRLVRLAGDAAVLSDRQREARAGATVDEWARESLRISTELAQALEVIDRLADDAGDTAVVSLADCADE
jgi:molybdenum-dependent DNA-binding transcriptional regulator ModE